MNTTVNAYTADKTATKRTTTVNAYTVDKTPQRVQISHLYLNEFAKRTNKNPLGLCGMIDDEVRVLSACVKCESGFKMGSKIPRMTKYLEVSPFAIDVLNLADVVPMSAMKILFKQVIFLTEKAFEAHGQLVFATKAHAIYSSGVVDLFRDPYALGTFLGVSWNKESFPLGEWRNTIANRFSVFCDEMELYLKVTPNLTSTQKKCEEIIMDFRFQPNFHNLYRFLRFMFTEAAPAEHPIDDFIDRRLKHCKSLEQFLSVEYQERMRPMITMALKMQMTSEYFPEGICGDIHIDDNLNMVFS